MKYYSIHKSFMDEVQKVLKKKGDARMWKWKIRFWWNRLLRKLGIQRDGVYYVGGKTVLPAPLDKEEEKDLLERLSEGDKTARAMLIEHNLRLVVYIARKFENTGVHIERKSVV